ncbi:PREDICTED: peroxisomal membrane protein PEX16 isoform X2 [Dufourea novaeangliae]|uniref:peroxisomal membrane protein PEX16 isoform X2 n=1 Tax=Dufourea novaeangliae TaxID=178035 RepID=UPI000766EFCA|nr:PREDICTED: peroxisomal membrane protein PEX16 isoform X2 [Dufourea novaeangliae]
MVFDKLNTSVLKIIEPYRKWAIENPKLLTDLEETVQCLSYFTAGRFNNSTLTSELIYSLSNLIVLCNDLLMCSGKCLHLKFPQFKSKIKIWLTVVEYTETLFEISAKKIWGPSGRWFIVIVIQVFKSVRGSNSTHMRTWEPLSSNVKDNLNSSPVSERNIALAESLYVMKPLFHLGCISLTGEKQWPPWLLSLAIDLFSLKIFNKEVKKAVSLSKEDERELYKRRLALLLYILRSPFYDRCSRTRIYAILTALSNNVPLAKFIAEPIKRYLPHWQSTYFYVWSS